MSNLLLIDNRLHDTDIVVNSLTENTKYIILDYQNDTLQSILDKIQKLNITNFTNIGIFQENYNLRTYSLVNSFGESKLRNIQEIDPNLESWNIFKTLIQTLKNNYGMSNLDLMGCSIHSNSNWNYVIDKFSYIYFRTKFINNIIPI